MIIIASYSNVSVTYTADGTQTVFSFPFDYLRKAFVLVEVNGETDLEQGTDYTVSDDKTVIFQTAPVADTVLRIYRQTDTTPLVSWADASVLRATDMTIQQVQELHILEEYQYNNVIAINIADEAKEIAEGISDTANKALDTASEALDIANGISGTATEALDNSEEAIGKSNEAINTANNASDVAEGIAGTAAEALSTANNALNVANGIAGTADTALTRAGQAIEVANEAKDDIQELEIQVTENAANISELSDTVTELLKSALWYNNVTALKADTKLTEGKVAITKGFRVAGDGGSSIYLIRAKESGETTDTWSVLQLATSTLVAELYVPDGKLNVKQCGAYGNNSNDDSTFIKYALNSTYKTILFPPGTYAVSSRLTIKEGKHLIGHNATLHKTDSSTSFIELGDSNITIENLSITRGNNRASGNVTSLVLIHSTTGGAIANIRVTNCIIRNADMYGVNIEDDNNYIRHVLIDHCYIFDVTVGVKNGGGYTRGIVIDSCSIHDTLGECVTFDGTVQNSKLTNCLLYNNDGGVGLVGCDSSSYITIANNTFTQVGNPASARSLQRGLAFNRHMGICNGYVISGNTFNNCYIGVYCKRAETDSQGTWVYNGVKNLVCSNNVFYNSEAADIRIDNIEGDNTFVNNVSNDRSKLYVLLSANKTTIQSRSRFDTENIFSASASDVSVTNSAKSVCSLTLPAGIYLVTGHLGYHSVVAGRQFIGLNDAVSIQATTDSCHIHYSNTAIAQTLGMNTSRIFNLSSSTTIHLIGYSNATVTVDSGVIHAVRIN